VTVGRAAEQVTLPQPYAGPWMARSFRSWEFRTLVGVSRDEMRSVLADWPDRSDSVATLAMNNALVNIGGYPHRAWDAWVRFSDSSPEEIHEVLERRRGSAKPDFGE
jgi:hypothetical protein